MTSLAGEELDPVLLLFGPGVADAPLAAYATLREQCPVAHSSLFGAPAAFLSRYEEVDWALHHPELFTTEDAIALGQEQPLIPLQVDPPEHSDYRRMLNPQFTPKRMAELEADVRALTVELLDGFSGRETIDFHNDFATPLPSTIFLRLMGLPQSDLPQFLRWRDDVIRPDVPVGDIEGAAAIRARAGAAINAYFEQALARHREHPDDGLMTTIVQGTVAGRPLTQDELLGICHLMLLGGLDTVTATLDCMVAYLAGQPDKRQAIAANPAVLPPLIEEMLRTETPVMVVPRMVKTDVEVGGVQLRKGTGVTLVIGAANADPAVFDDPHQVDASRKGARHLAFGSGHHLCLGQHLARLELRVALEELHARYPDYELPSGTTLSFSPGIRQAEQFPLRLGAAS